LTAGQLIEKSRQEAGGDGIEAASPPPVTLTAGPITEKSGQESGRNGTEAASPQPVTLTASPLTEKPAQEANAARTKAASLEPDASAEGSGAGKTSREALNLEAVAHSSEEPLAGPNIEVRCNLKLPSCRKWLALAETRSQKALALPSAASRQ
jgi:hypothetical protein